MGYNLRVKRHDRGGHAAMACFSFLYGGTQMNLLKTTVAAATLAIAAGSASAATFNFGGSSGATSSKSFTVDGITAVATAFREGPLGFLQFVGNVTQNASGLGVSSFPDTSGDIDGFILKDTLVLTFDQLVSFSLATFGAVDRQDDWDIYVDNGSGNWVQVANDITDNPFNFNGGTVKRIAFGADGGDDDFRLSSVQVSAVPLPAGGWLLIAGIGGLVALRRKRKAA